MSIQIIIVYSSDLIYFFNIFYKTILQVDKFVILRKIKAENILSYNILLLNFISKKFSAITP